jgi:hemoglobin-like flavoprotein
MTTEEITLVKESWKLVAANPQAAGQLFYTRLFTIAPELRPMFRSDMATQSNALMTMINYVVNKLDKLGEIISEVEGLARRHVKYGVKDEHYVIVGDALLWTLKMGLGAHWTDDVKDAWVTCYTLLSSAMISASHVTNEAEG